MIRTVDTRYPELDLDRQHCFRLYAAARAVVRAYGPLLGPVGLTYPQYLAMLALWESPEGTMTVGALGERLRLDTGTLTPLLKRLESAGHVSRRRDPADERRVLLAVTDEGWALRDRVTHVPSEILRSIDLAPGEVADLRRLLDLVVEQLEQDSPTP